MLPPSPMLTIKFRRFGVLLLLALLAGCTPAGPRALLQGKRLIDEGKYPEAVEKLQSATVLLGTNALACAQAWNYLGVAYQHGGDPAASEKAYQRALALNHDLAEAHYNLGCLLLAENKLESARTEFTAYTLRRGSSPEGFLKLGTVQLRTRDLGAAEKSFSDALRLSPQNPEAFNGLGLVRLQQRRAADAAQCFASALKAQPEYRPALLNLAIVQQNVLKDRPAALQHYREYLALKPAPANAAAVAETVRQLEVEMNPPARSATQPISNPVAVKTPPPEAPARTVIAAKPESVTNVPKPPVSTSNSKPAIGTNPPPSPGANTSATPPAPVEVVKLTSEPVIKPAQDVSTPARPARSSNPEPQVTTSSVPANATAPKTARKGFFEKVNPLNLFHGSDKATPKTTPLPASGSSAATASGASSNRAETSSVPASTPVPYTGARYRYKSPATPAAGNRAAAQRACDQAIAAYQAHKIADAAQAYGQATQLDPSYFEAQYNYGLAATDAGNLNAALLAYEYALAIRPESADARYNFALVLKQAKYYADAAGELEKLLATNPGEARAHLALANLYAQQLSDPARARLHYQRVLELEPRNPQASAIRFWLASNPQ